MRNLKFHEGPEYRCVAAWRISTTVQRTAALQKEEVPSGLAILEFDPIHGDRADRHEIRS